VVKERCRLLYLEKVHKEKAPTRGGKVGEKRGPNEKKQRFGKKNGCRRGSCSPTLSEQQSQRESKKKGKLVRPCKTKMGPNGWESPNSRRRKKNLKGGKGKCPKEGHKKGRIQTKTIKRSGQLCKAGLNWKRTSQNNKQRGEKNIEQGFQNRQRANRTLRFFLGGTSRLEKIVFMGQ